MKTHSKRVVVKIGTNVMTNKDNRIVVPILKRIVDQVARLYDCLLYTSDAADE